MTILQKKIFERSKDIKRMGSWMVNGMITITAENERVFQTCMAAMIEANENDRRLQEETFQQMPWLKKMAEKRGR